jgi:hypothetical protein
VYAEFATLILGFWRNLAPRFRDISALNCQVKLYRAGVVFNMKGENLSQFHHRVNADKTIDSICLRCFLTAATVENEADLHEREAAHQCYKEPNILSETLRNALAAE